MKSELGPQVTFVIGYFMQVQESPKVVFEAHLAMVMCLSFDISLDAWHLGLADSKSSVSILPTEC